MSHSSLPTRDDTVDQLILAPTLRRQTFIDLLKGAKFRVQLSLFRCDDSRILDEIVATARRGVEVRMLITPKAKGWNKRLGSLVMLLKHTGVDVKQYDGPWKKYHAKYFVIDSETAVVGSANLTRRCFDDTCDFILISRDSQVVASVAALFDADWDHPDAPVHSVSNRLLVGPDNLRTRVMEALGSARSRIRIIDHRVSHPDILLLLVTKRLEGVLVEVLGRGEVGNLASHGKLFLIDDHLAIIGSASLSRPGLNVRREVAISIEEPSMIRNLSSFFEEMNAKNQTVAENARATDVPDDDEDEE